MLSHYLRAIACSVVVFFSPTIHGQVDIILLDPDPYLIRSNNLFFGTLQNSGPQAQVVLEVRIESSDGGLIVQAESAPMDVGEGMLVITSLDPTIVNSSYGSNASARYLNSFGTLPSGLFKYCMEVVPYSNAESGDQDCTDLFSEALAAMDLMYPMDGDTIMETRPTLNWMTTEPVLGNNDLEFSLILVEALADQDPYSSIAIGQPIILLPKVSNTMVSYPVDAEALISGRSYAWQITKTVAGSVIDETEAWKFTVFQEPIPQPAKYVMIDHAKGASFYRPVDDRIYFRFDEPYNSGQLACSIIKSNGLIIEPAIFNDSDKESKPLKAQGINEYELDLLPYDLDKGTYTLKVQNEKGHFYYLKFLIE